MRRHDLTNQKTIAKTKARAFGKHPQEAIPEDSEKIVSMNTVVTMTMTLTLTLK